jgi:hypothetical protein
MIIELLGLIKLEVMKGKILGISLSVLGVVALIITLIGILGDVSPRQVNMLLAGGIVGTILFFMGIWLLPGRTVHHSPALPVPGQPPLTQTR